MYFDARPSPPVFLHARSFRPSRSAPPFHMYSMNASRALQRTAPPTPHGHDRQATAAKTGGLGRPFGALRERVHAGWHARTHCTALHRTVLALPYLVYMARRRACGRRGSDGERAEWLFLCLGCGIGALWSAVRFRCRSPYGSGMVPVSVTVLYGTVRCLLPGGVGSGGTVLYCTVLYRRARWLPSGAGGVAAVAGCCDWLLSLAAVTGGGWPMDAAPPPAGADAWGERRSWRLFLRIESSSCNAMDVPWGVLANRGMPATVLPLLAPPLYRVLFFV